MISLNWKVFGTLGQTIAIALMFCAAGCSPQIGPTITIQELPSPAAPSTGPKVGFGKSVAVGPFTDSRIVPVDGAPESATTEAVGETGALVENHLREVLLRHGYTVSETAPVRIQGQVVRWDTTVTTIATTKIDSHAAIAVEVLRNGTTPPVYTATYVGSRTSESPVASKNDIRNSLGIAATSAIENIVEDQKLINAISQ